MRIGRRSNRRASLARRVGAVLFLGMLTAMAPVLHPEPVSAASGVDDYPARLRNAPQDSLVDPWQFYNRECTSFVAWRLNSENQVAFNDYWQGQHWGNASNWKNAALALEDPGRQQPEPRRRRLVGGRLGRLVARPRRVGADRRRRRDHDRGVQLPPRRQVRHPHHLELQLAVAERVHPHQGHPGAQHGGADGVRDAAGRQEADHHPRHVERQEPHLQLPVAGQRQADRRGDDPVRSSPSAAQVGKHLRAKVTATKSGAHPARRGPPPTDGVAKGVFVNTDAADVDGKAQVGVPLAAHRGPGHPAGTFSYQWLAGGKRIDGATRQLHAHRRPARPGPEGEGRPQGPRLQDPASEVRPRPGASSPDGSAPAGADDLRQSRRSTSRSPPTRAPGRRPARSSCSGWPTVRRSRAPPARRTPRSRRTSARTSPSRSPSSSVGTTTPSQRRPPPWGWHRARSSTPRRRRSRASPRSASR